MVYFQVICLSCLCIFGYTPVLGKSTPVQLSSGQEKGPHPGGGLTELAMRGESTEKHSTDVIIPSSHAMQSDEEPSPFHGFYSQDYQGANEKRTGGSIRTTRIKRTPTGFTARGFHEGVFDRDFGHFSPVKRSQKRKPEADAAGFYGDTFSNGFGEFETMKRDMYPYGAISEKEISQLFKRRPEMGATGFHGDTFAQGFGEFDTMKKRYPYNWIETVKRKPEMTKSGFHGDLFNSGFGEFHPMKK